MARVLVEPLFLSESTNGLGIKVVPTATPGTLIHTAHATNLDRIYLYAYNSSNASVMLTIEWGGVTDPDHHIKESIPLKSGVQLVVPGLLLTGGVEVRAYAGTANVIIITGEVERATLE